METLPAGKSKEELKKEIEEKAQKFRPEPLPEKDNDDPGIKDLKEVVAFGIVLTTTVFEVAGDGLGPLDIIDLLRAEDLRNAFADAFDGIQSVDDEVRDLSVSEGFDVAKFAWDRIEKAFL